MHDSNFLARVSQEKGFANVGHQEPWPLRAVNQDHWPVQPSPCPPARSLRGRGERILCASRCIKQGNSRTPRDAREAGYAGHDAHGATREVGRSELCATDEAEQLVTKREPKPFVVFRPFLPRLRQFQSDNTKIFGFVATKRSTSWRPGTRVARSGT